TAHALDHGCDPVTLDPSDDAGETVAGRLGDDRPVGRSPAPFLEETGHFVDLDQPLSTVRPLHPQPAVRFPAPQCLDRDPEHLGRLADADAWGRIVLSLRHTEEYGSNQADVSRSYETRTQILPRRQKGLSEGHWIVRAPIIPSSKWGLPVA